MKFAIALLALAALTVASKLVSETELETHFNLFKTQFGRNYKNSEEEAYRKRVFASNLEFIFNHNREYLAGKKSFDMGVNEFTDMTNAEFRARFNGYRNSPFQSSALQQNTYKASEKSAESLPPTVDWTTEGVVTPVKNQGHCGSCWAFATVASIESQHALKTGNLVSLSEQNLVDCSHNGPNNGCHGGLVDPAFEYVIANRGIDTEESYPYVAHAQYCQFHNDSVGATIRSYVDISRGDELSLQSAVAKFGPISLGIDASSPLFQFYKSGVYDDHLCSNTPTNLDHGVAVVGYGTLNGKKFWKVKNSWGTTWGNKGYILMSRDKNNQCGIATSASRPVV